MALEPITRQEKIISGQDLTPITRMEKFLKQYGGGSGGATSWNDLTDKPFYKEVTETVIEWDGNTDGMIVVDPENDYGQYYKVSDTVYDNLPDGHKIVCKFTDQAISEHGAPPVAELPISYGVTYINGREYTAYHVDIGYTVTTAILLVPKDDPYFQPGTYFEKNLDLQTVSLTITDEIIHKIDPVFLPTGGGGGGDGFLNIVFTAHMDDNKATCNATYQQVMDALTTGTIGVVTAIKNQNGYLETEVCRLLPRTAGDDWYIEQDCFELEFISGGTWGCYLLLNIDGTATYVWWD